MWTIARTAWQCAKMMLGLAFAGLMGVILFIGLIQFIDTYLKIYVATVGLFAVGAFIYMTVSLAKGDDNEKEDFA